MTTYKLTVEQAQAILDMQLRRLAALERQKIDEEYQSLQELITELEDLLAHPKKILALIRDNLNELAEKYGDERRTEIVPGAEGDFNEADLVADEDVLIFLTRNGYIKRVSAEAYRTQGRGGKGLIGMTTRDEDVVEEMFAAGSLDSILFFSDRGKVYQEKAYVIPDAGRTSRGIPLQAVLALQSDERITAAVAVQDFEEAEYCTMVTRLGRIKRTIISEFESVRPSGLIAINLDEGDALRWVKMTTGNQDLIIVTRDGMSIRFNEEDARPMGRTAAGVNAIRLRGDDVIAGMDVIEDPDDELLIVSENAYGKRTPLNEYNTQGRYGLGVRTLARNEKTGSVIAARTVQPGDHVTFITRSGQALRTPIDGISRIGRNTQGVQLMNLPDGGKLASVALLEEDRRLERQKALEEERAQLETMKGSAPQAERPPKSYEEETFYAEDETYYEDTEFDDDGFVDDTGEEGGA
jgi:DNA gyrase subunit A